MSPFGLILLCTKDFINKIIKIKKLKSKSITQINQLHQSNLKLTSNQKMPSTSAAQYRVELISNIIRQNVDKWYWPFLSQNKAITWDVVQANPDLPWDWRALSANPNITWEIVVNNPTQPWNFASLSCNPSITVDIITSNPQFDWDIAHLSANPNLDMQFILANPNLPWSFPFLSGNPNLTVEVVIALEDKPWEWSTISKNSNITIDTVWANPDFLWDWDALSRNPNITQRTLEDNPEFPWNIDAFLFTHSNTLDILDSPFDHTTSNIFEYALAHPTLDWNWHRILAKSPFSLELLQNNIANNVWNWGWGLLSENPNLTWDIVQAFPNKPWSWFMMSSNPSIFDVSAQVEKWSKKHMAAYKIQQKWLNAYYHPNSPICQRRLQREFTSLIAAI